MRAARVRAVSGAVVLAETTSSISIGEVVYVGRARLLGEVVALDGDVATLQVYEDTEGLRPGDAVEASGAPLAVELGPGLLGQVFDGVQRPLDALARREGDLLARGARAPALDRSRRWWFTPAVAVGADVRDGQVIGTVPETPAVEHRLLVPPRGGGRVLWLASEGDVGVDDCVARVESDDGTAEIRAHHRWRARAARPFLERLSPRHPLITGQRVLDTLYPLARGGAAGMPGGFGTGKTIMQHQLCRWADADVIVYVGCGERGNEMTEMLRRLPELTDPRTGRPLAERTVLVANTSNMPVAAREASLYCGLTIAEYYRDMGYHAVLLADSTSRWAEALRELGGRLGEMPAEEGYPSYLSSRLAAYYERAGRVRTLGGAEGSVTLISAISPAGGDLTEPVTRHTQRFTRTFWTLDQSLAAARVFPAVSTRDSYCDLPSGVTEWWVEHVGPDWPDRRGAVLALVDEADRIESTARLVGTDALPERQQLVLRFARVVEEGFLRQSAFDDVDAFCAPARQHALLALILDALSRAEAAIERGAPARALGALPELAAIERAKTEVPDAAGLASLLEAFDAACGRLESPAPREVAP
ncbi:MAG: V-type ATP synthase subunit A [Acidobacteriota bacterium]